MNDRSSRRSPIRSDGLPGTLDPIAFARDGSTLEGNTDLEHLPRLRQAGVLELFGTLAWRIDGERTRDSLERLREFLHVQIAFVPTMTCMRCLEPVHLDPIASHRALRLAASEAQAAQEDQEAGDVDVIAATGPLDFAQLVEDEALLTLPMVPMHPFCPEPES